MMQTPFKASKLDSRIAKPMAFTLEHTEVYFSCLNALEDSLDLNGAHAVQAALNVTAATFFMSVHTKKNWYFNKPIWSANSTLANLDVVKLKSVHGDEANYTVIGQDETAATVMLIDNKHQLNDSKVAQQFSLIRIDTDFLYTSAKTDTSALQQTA